MYIKGANAEPSENRINNPSRSKNVIMGMSHIFFRSFRNWKNSRRTDNRDIVIFQINGSGYSVTVLISPWLRKPQLRYVLCGTACSRMQLQELPAETVYNPGFFRKPSGGYRSHPTHFKAPPTTPSALAPCNGCFYSHRRQ